jgi:hypothetical protein
VKAHYKGANIVVSLYYNLFFKGIILNYNHAIIRMIFIMLLHFMVGQNKKKSNAREVSFFNFICYNVIIYLHRKNVHHKVLKMKIYDK